MGPLLRPSELRSRAGGFPFREGSEAAVGFVAWGRGVRQQIRVPELSLTDIAPTIAKLLGLRLDDGLDGRPLVGILRASQPLPPPGPKRLGCRERWRRRAHAAGNGRRSRARER